MRLVAICEGCDAARRPSGTCGACGAERSGPLFVSAEAVLSSVLPGQHPGTIVGETAGEVRRARTRRLAAP